MPSSTSTTAMAAVKADAEVGEQEGQGVADAAQAGHKTANQAANPGMAAPGEAAVVR